MTDRNYELLYEEYGYQEELCNEASVLRRKKWGKKCVRKGQMMTKVYYQKQWRKYANKKFCKKGKWRWKNYRKENEEENVLGMNDGIEYTRRQP